MIVHQAELKRRMQPARGHFARFDLDRQMASTLPAHCKVGPAPVFWASQPLEPAEWLALLILKAGDVESNPGPPKKLVAVLNTIKLYYNNRRFAVTKILIKHFHRVYDLLTKSSCKIHGTPRPKTITTMCK